MPGWIDAHTHMLGGVTASIYADPRQLLNGVRSCWRAVGAGLTSVVDLGCRSHAIFELRAAAEERLFTAPRIFSAGQAICMTGGHGHGKVAVEADGEAGVQQMTRRQLGAGADVIKLMATGGAGSQHEAQGGPQFDIAEMAAGVAEATKAGRPITAHATSAAGILAAIEAGVDVIQHGTGMSREGAAALAKIGGYVVPTMSVGPRSASGALAKTPSYMAAKSAAKAQQHIQGIENALAAGVTIGFGTDSGGEYHPLGDTELEIELLIELGMKPMDIVKAATVNNATWLGVDDHLGSVKTGFGADLMLVDGDASTDATALTAIRHVWVRGRQVVVDGRPVSGSAIS
jgi:imidazolonepropionase-like amidohydrolase